MIAVDFLNRINYIKNVTKREKQIMYEVVYSVYGKTKKSKKFDDHVSAKKFFFYLAKQSWSRSAELKKVA